MSDAHSVQGVPEWTPTLHVDPLSDADLEVLNGLLPWRCFTLDGHGRRYGAAASETKRNVPQTIPDRRIVELDRRTPLAGRSVLEIGCFEGVHTTALAQRARQVVAVDSRIENVVKTLVRTWSFGLRVDALRCDVEDAAEVAALPEVDVAHHVGVLYHLRDPVAHLRRLLPKIRQALMLDTHVAGPGEAKESYQSDGDAFAYRSYREGGRQDVFSGMYDHAKWLPLATIVTILRDAGFVDVDVAEERQERNGPRVLLFARRSTG